MDLLSKCGQDYTSRDSYYYKISSRRMRAKEVGRNSALAFYETVQVQIIPWVISDSNYVKCAAPRLDPQVGKKPKMPIKYFLLFFIDLTF